ncbi:MAG: 50S ribosomal protein L30 [Chthonomonadales bacterium]|nr:50S ribosomal protein L30 [Chthonomonadales bacterium]
MHEINVKLIRSPIGYNERQKRTVRALGLTRMNQTVTVPDNPQTRGMVRAVRHLVDVTEMPTDDANVASEEQADAAS